MKKSIENKWFYILLSVLVAVSVWLYVRLGEDPELEQRARQVPVILSGERVLENQGLMVESVSDMFVDLSWKGRWSEVGQLTDDSVTVSIDLARVTEPGTYELDYSINLPATVMSSAVSLQRGQPAQITVVVSRVYSKNLTIHPEFSGSVADGYRAGEFIVEPETVLVSGPYDRIELIDTAKVFLEQKKMNESFAGDLDVVLLDKQGNVIDHDGLTLSTGKVYSYLPVLAMKTVPLDVGIIAGGGASEENVDYTVTPSTVTISGPEEELALIDRIELDVIDLSQIVGDHTQEYPILLPAGMDNISGYTAAELSLEIHGMQTKTVSVDRIVITNTPKHLKSELLTKAIKIEVRGTEEALSKLREEQINVVADLSGITTAGSYNIPVKITLNKETPAGVLGQYNAVIKLTKS